TAGRQRALAAGRRGRRAGAVGAMKQRGGELAFGGGAGGTAPSRRRPAAPHAVGAVAGGIGHEAVGVVAVALVVDALELERKVSDAAVARTEEAVGLAAGGAADDAHAEMH